MTYRVLVTGSRDWPARSLADKVLDGLIAKHGADNLILVLGDCPTGIDSVFHHACLEKSIQTERFKADWQTHGKAAGPMRNAAMVASGADVCLAFHPFIRNSKGTRDCLLQALKAGIPTWLAASNDGDPVRQNLEDWA